jgi:DNA-binding transcriptional LysR family regulator
MRDWDDLRFFIAAARAGSLAAAGERLGVDAATVGRRVGRLESELKSTLIVRSPRGLELTAAGSRLLEAGLAAESAMDATARVGEPDVVGGTVRISAAEGFGTVVLAPSLPELRHRRPNLRVELAAHAGFLSATRREVDMAITLSALSDPRLIVEPLTDYQLAIYGSDAYFACAGRPASLADLHHHEMVGYVDDLIFAPELRYLEELDPTLRPQLASSSIRAQRAIIDSGGGVGVLPCFMASGLERVVPEVLITRRFWMSTHRDVSDAARIRALRAWIKQLVLTHAKDLRPL